MVGAPFAVVDTTPAATPEPTRPARRWRVPLSYPFWVVLAVLAGVVLRVARWSDGRSLNSDELWIVLNLRDRSFGELAGPLDYDQLAPLGWLWLQKAVLLVSGSDAALRLPALVTGCAVLMLTAVLARRLLPAPLAVAAVVLVAGGPMLIYQSSQVKQYSFEAAAGLLLLILALRVLADPGARRPAALFWVTGAVAVWFATTAIFVTGAVGALLFLFWALDRQWRLVRRHLLTAIPAVVSVVVVRLTAPPPAGWLYEWWSDRYPGSLAPRPIGFRTAAAWTVDLADRFRISALGMQSKALGALVLLLLAVGVVTLLRRAPRPGALVVAPLVAGYLLALLRLYPMAGRVALWLVPIALLLVAAGVDGLARAAGALVHGLAGDRHVGPRRVSELIGTALPAAAAVALVVVLLPELGTAPRRTNADRYATAEDAVRFIAANRRPGDLVLSHLGKSNSALVDWYGPRTDLRPDGQYTAAVGRACSGAGQPPGLAGARRVWLLHVSWVSKARARRDPERAAMARYGQLTGEWWFGGVVVLRYEPPPGPRPPAGAGCLVVRSSAG